MSEETKTKFKLENLVVLRFALLIRNLELVDISKALKDKKFSLLNQSQWRYDFPEGLGGSIVHGINQPRLYFPPEYDNGVIGVFDKTYKDYLYTLNIACEEALKIIDKTRLE